MLVYCAVVFFQMESVEAVIATAQGSCEAEEGDLPQEERGSGSQRVECVAGDGRCSSDRLKLGLTKNRNARGI